MQKYHYVHQYVYAYKTINVRRGNNLKKNWEGYMEGFGERKQKGDMYLYYYL